MTLEVGGSVETYWKSMAIAVPSNKAHSVLQPIESAHASPSVHSVAAPAGSLHTISSLKDRYVYAVVQVTRDYHPVIFSDWTLPVSEFNLGVADVTLEQFETVAVRSGKDIQNRNKSAEWVNHVGTSMISLARLMTVCLPTPNIQYAYNDPLSCRFSPVISAYVST